MVLEYIEGSALIANVLSVIALGIMGVVVRSIVLAFGELKISAGKIALAQSEYDQRKILAKMMLVNGRLYKNAVLASNLSNEGKVQVIEDFEDLKGLFKQFKKLELDVVKAPVTEVADEPLLEQFLDDAKDVAVDIGENMLDKLREEINA